MTKAVLIPIALALAASACARPDPRVQAAQDFQRTAFELIERDNERQRKLNSLRLGMSDSEVLNVAGPPSRRDSLGEGTREVWTYQGELKQLGVLTFEDGRLTQLRVP